MSVDLSILVERHLLQLDGLVRNHKGRKNFLQFFFQILFITFSGVKQDQPLLLRIIDAAGTGNAVPCHGIRLHFTKLNAVPQMLDLEILAGNINKISVRIVTPDVTRPVNPFRITIIQRILDKRRRSPFRIPIVAKSNAGSAHADLALTR